MSTDPLFRRIKLHAEKRLRFTPEMTQAQRLPKLKEFLRLEDEMLQRYHNKGDSGLRVAMARSIMIDVLIESLYQVAISTYEIEYGTLPCDVCVVALGGYGREELCPFSDIDLMFLYPTKVKDKILTPMQELLTNEILYPLWDLKFKVGHSSRTVKETIEEAKSDNQTKNALLESRIICGSKTLFKTFEKSFKNYYQKADAAPYVEERLEDQKSRRTKYGNTVFLQEPDIKNGVGGLRDYQNILWMAQVTLGARSLDEIVEKNFLEEADKKQLLTAYSFLLRTRNELHFQSNRPTDLLNLEKQPRIAWGLGYRQKNIFVRVEAFMRDYYSHAQKIYLTSKLLEQRLAVADIGLKKKSISLKAALFSRRFTQEKTIDGFLFHDDEISFSKNDVFKEDPARLIRIFRYQQQYELKLDLDLSILITQSLPLITFGLINDPAVNKTFRSILQSKGNVYPILLNMHELGVLGRFMPEFGKLNCLVQHEYYHRYTADIHVLNTIQELDNVFNADDPETRSFRDELYKTSKPGLLYIILLLHDIGKSHSIKGHCEHGVTIAIPILKRLQVAEKLHPPILLIIKQHLEMARFWQRFDVDDPRTAESFAKIVKDPDSLRYLYVHTYCDAKGTAGSLWNNYKNTLHQRLFHQTLEFLNNEQSPAERQKEKKEHMYNEIIEKRIPEIPQEEIEAHFNLLPERYFLHNSPEEIELHIKMVNQLLTNISEADSIGSLLPIIDWNDDVDQGLTAVNIVTWDRAGLFYKLAGALTVAGLNILSTKAISRSDHITIDTFYVVAPGGGVVQSERIREIFQQEVEESLLRNKNLMPGIVEQAKAQNASTSLLKSTDNLKARIPCSVAVYHELSLRRTIIEVQANDHLGLLYQLSKSISDHGFDINFARVATERGAAIDTFYIEAINQEDNNNNENLVKLRNELNKIVASEAFLAVI